MIHITVTTRSGERREITGRPGQTLMAALHAAGVDELRALCGGAMTCATCHVYVSKPESASRAAFGEAEADFLARLRPYRENSRLSCQLMLTSEHEGLEVALAPER
jgi:2Fe-2S ferredoxin